MAASNKWNSVGEDIMNSVLKAVESGDYTGLSQCVGDVINQAADRFGRNMNQAGRQVGRQTKEYTQTVKQTIYGQQAQLRRERAVNGTVVSPKQPPMRYRRYLPGQAAGPVCHWVLSERACLVWRQSLPGDWCLPEYRGVCRSDLASRRSLL